MRKHMQRVVLLVLALSLGTQLVFAFGQRAVYSRPFSFSDYWDMVANVVPEFSGAYLAPDGAVHVYLTQPTPQHEPTVAQALASVFGQTIFVGVPEATRSLADPGAIVLRQGTYTVRELMNMKARLLHLLEGGSALFIDLNETQNRLVVAVEDDEAAQLLLLHLRLQGIPLDAVVVELVDQTLVLPDDHDPQAVLVREWHQKVQSERFRGLPGVGVIAHIPDDLIVPFRIEIASPATLLLLARELRAVGIPLSAVFVYERE